MKRFLGSVFGGIIGALVVTSGLAMAQNIPSVWSSLTSFNFKGLGNANGAPNTTNGDWYRFDGSGAQGGTRTADTTPRDGELTAQSAWSQATVHTTGGAINVGAGLGRRLLAMTRANCSGKTVTVTLNGTGHVLTEGVDWARGSSDTTAATSLSAAIKALSGVTSSSSAGTVFVERDEQEGGVVALTLATNDGTCAGITSGTDGTYTEWMNASFKGTLSTTGAYSPTGGISTTIADGANAACTTTCGSKACITGFDAGTSAFVACATNTADTCLCGP